MSASSRRSVLAGTVALLAFGSAVSGALAAATREIELRPTTAYPAARGTAHYQRQPGQRELEVEVEHIRALAGRRVVITVAGKKLGTARVSVHGVARLSRNTERGQAVPRVTSGTTAKVRTSAGRLIVSGTF